MERHVWSSRSCSFAHWLRTSGSAIQGYSSISQSCIASGEFITSPYGSCDMKELNSGFSSLFLVVFGVNRGVSSSRRFGGKHAVQALMHSWRPITFSPSQAPTPYWWSCFDCFVSSFWPPHFKHCDRTCSPNPGRLVLCQTYRMAPLLACLWWLSQPLSYFGDLKVFLQWFFNHDQPSFISWCIPNDIVRHGIASDACIASTS